MGFAAYGKSCQLIYIATMLLRERSSCGRPLNAPAAFIQTCQPIFAILLIAAVPVYAHAQKPTARVSKGDAQKVVTIISGDKAKTHTYCDIKKLGEQDIVEDDQVGAEFMSAVAALDSLENLDQGQK